MGRNNADFHAGTGLSPDMQSSVSTMAPTGASAPDWDTHYGKAFKLVQTPSGAATDSKTGKPVNSAPGTVSLVTPYNGDAFNSWTEASDDVKNNFKSNWNSIWGSTGGYKQRQILGAMNG